MPELLLELLSEEIPARMQARAAEDLERLVTARLTAAGLDFKQARAYVTPRRLALVVTGLPAKQPDTIEEKKGPRVDAPDKAIQGFMRGHNLASIDQAELRETDKGSFYFLVRKLKGQASAKVLPGIIVEAIEALTWPKSMRWGANGFTWVRPLHGVAAVFDGKKLSGTLELGDGAALAFGNTTVGHRFMAPKKFAVQGFADYKKKLKAAKVMLDPAERRATIEKQAAREAARAKLAVRDDPALLDEVTGLVEWPVVLMGRIEDRFMALPPEVLTTSMRAHQKYLALTDESGALANRFLVVANMETADGGKAIAAGNERVLRARLADARFFWDQDRKQPLSARTPRLGEIVFHAKLGSLDEKIDRVQALAVEIAGHIEGADKDRVRSAARLCKADLVTGMVGEFPELQGIMGRYYALADGEHAEVADAIAEHYAPQGPGDACPSAPVSVALALADKIDTLVGFWAIDEKPTGSKDPYALRRAALGVIRLIVENDLRLPLMEIFERAFHGGPIAVEGGWEGIAGDLLDFFAERLKVALRERGVRHDLIAAVFALGGEDDLVRLLSRVAALGTFLETDDGANLLVAFRRVNNIVRIEEEKSDEPYEGDDVEPSLLKEAAEKELFDVLNRVLEQVVQARDQERYEDACRAFATLRAPVDRFFDTVRVNVDDTRMRENRLRLLDRIRSRFFMLADFSKIEG